MIKTINIENGPTLYLYSNKRRHSTFFQIVTKFGGMTKDFISNNKEYHIQDGVAHILEHYVVENNQRGNFLNLLGDMQMYTNASTSLFHTDYYFEAIENYLDGIETMLNGIYSVEFNKEKLEKLKEPIYQEIRGKMNSKYYHSSITEMVNLFHGTTFKNIGGSLDEVKNTTIDDIKLCYETFYQPSNQIIFIGGNFNEEETIKFIKEFYKKLNHKKVDFELIKNKEYDSVVKKKEIVEFPTEQDSVKINFKINATEFSNREKLDYDFYLSYFYKMFFLNSSKLYKRLVEEKIITGSIMGNCAFFDDYFVFSVEAYTDYKEKFIDGVLETIKELDDFNEEIFELEKKDTIISFILRDDNIMNMLIPFISNVLEFDYPYMDKISDIENMTYEGFVSAIKKLDFSNYNITIITNKK